MTQVACICPRVPPGRPRRGFTLVELLVVVGIIGLLISVLLPALSKARREAQRMQCLSNLRNMQIAQINYATDNKGYLIQAGMGHGGAHADEGLTWFNTLNAYYGGKLVSRCPSDTSLYWETPLPPSLSLRRTSYGINAFLDKDLCPWGPGFEPPIAGGQYVKISQVRRTSEVIQFAEMAYGGEYAASDHVHADLFSTSSTPPPLVPRIMARYVQVHAHGGKADATGRANYGFLDGHAESLTPREVYTSLYLNRFDPASPQRRP